MENEQNEQLELLKSMEAKLTHIEKKMKRQQIRSIIVWCLVLALIVAAAMVVVPKVQALVAQYNAAMAQVEKVSKAVEGVDFDALADVLGSIDYTKLKDTMEDLGKIDMDAVSEGVTRLNDAMKKLDKLNLDEITENINTFTEKLGPLLKLFG